VAFASAFGLSTWVAVAFAMVLAGWAVWVLGWERGSRARIAVMAVAGLVAGVALILYVTELLGEASGMVTAAGGGADSAAGPGRLLQFGVRHIIDPDALLGIPWLARMAKAHPAAEDAGAGLALLLPGYFVELGFYGLVLVAAWRARKRLDEAGRTALVLGAIGLAVATFLRSAVVENNDFAMRSVLIAQYFLLLLAVVWWEGGLGWADGWARRAMLGLVWIGVAGTVYQAAMLRVYLPVQDRLGQEEIAGLAERAMVWRDGFLAMDRKVPKDAIVQLDTGQPGDYFNAAQIIQAGRQMASALPVCAAAFGGDPAKCAGILQGVAALYPTHRDETAVNGALREGGGAPGADAARVECARLGVDELVATRWDEVWSDRASWVWGLPVVVDTGNLRVLDCGRARLAPGR
jgi:hypothetical protein